MIDKTISHYKIIKKIGEGGMGEVYLAEDTNLKRKVAIKFLSAHLTNSPENVERLKREARAAAALNHPNIVTMHEISESDGKTFIVMEYVQGRSLREILNDVDATDAIPLSIDMIINYIAQLCEGLSEAHQAGIVHRDIKPENILINGRGKVKILDFGLAKLRGVSKLTKESTILGTLHYMSPEQIQGKEIDHRTDIWSLGVVFYELLTGKTPFGAEYEQAIHYAIVNENPEPLPGNISEKLVSVIKGCLQKQPAERYQQVSDIVIGIETSDNKPGSESETPGKWFPLNILAENKNRFLIPGFLLAVIFLAVIGYLIFSPGAKSKEPVPIAVIDFDNQTGEESLNGLSGMLITALEQTHRLSVCTRTGLFDILKRMGRDDVERIDEDIGRQIAQYAGINLLVIASIQKFGQVYNIDFKILDPVKDRYIFTASAKDEGISNIPYLIDMIAEQTQAKLEIPVNESSLSGIEKITTPNLDAYKYYYDGETYLGELKITEAIHAFKKAISIDSTFILAYYKLAYCDYIANERSTNDFYIEQAVNSIDRAPKKEKSLINSLYKKIHGDYSESIDILKNAQKEFINDKVILFEIGDTYYSSGEFPDSAEVYLKKVFSLDSTHMRAIDHLIRLNPGYMNRDKVRRAAEKLIHNNPDGFVGYHIIGDYYFNQQEIDEALKYYKLGYEKDPGYYSTVLHLGILYNELSDFGNAFKFFQKALEMVKNDWVVYFGLGYCTFRLKIYEESLKKWLLAAEYSDKSKSPYMSALIYSFISDLNLLNTKNHQAEIYAIEALDLDSTFTKSKESLIYAYLFQSKFDQAKKIISTLDPKADWFLVSLLSAMTSLMSGKEVDSLISPLSSLVDEQLEDFIENLKIYPYKRGPQELLGDIYLKKGDKIKAKQHYTDLLTLCPDNIRIKNKILAIE